MHSHLNLSFSFSSLPPSWDGGGVSWGARGGTRGSGREINLLFCLSLVLCCLVLKVGDLWGRKGDYFQLLKSKPKSKIKLKKKKQK